MGQGEGPRPASLQSEPGPAGTAGDPCSGVKEPVADRLPLGSGQRGVQQWQNKIKPGVSPPGQPSWPAR